MATHDVACPCERRHDGADSSSNVRCARSCGQLYCCDEAMRADAPFHEILCCAPLVVRSTGARKGLGLFATRSLAPGEMLFEERPLIVSPAQGAIDVHLFVDLDDVALGVTARAAHTTLLTLSRQALMQLSDRGEPKSLTGVAHTNGVAIDAFRGGVFLVFSRLNHSCTPSAHFEYNPETHSQSVFVLRPIEAGEEVTVAYKDREMHMPRLLRRLRLFSTFGFECACGTCAEDCPVVISASDSRRTRIAQLFELIYDAMRRGDPDAAVGMCEERVALLSDEGLGCGVDMTNSLFLLSRALQAAGRERDAQLQMQLCVHESTRCRGAANPITRSYAASIKHV